MWLMARRIEVELTSKVDDDTWTWRAAGARQPKGRLASSLLPAGAKVGDVVRAEVDEDIEGIIVLAILPPKEKRAEPERIVLIPRTDRPTPPVTTSRVERGPRPERGDRGDRGDRGERRDRGDRRDGDRNRERGPRTERPRADRSDRSERSARSERPDRPDRRQQRPARPKPEPAPERPKPKRLSPGHTHRNNVLASLPPEQKPIAEQLLRGGIPAVRQAIETQNAARLADNEGPIKAEPLLTLAEGLLPQLKVAEWRDRAEAANAAGDDISLRDLRSVVTGADVARDDDARLLARTLRERLDGRLKAERDTWVADIGTALDEGRTVRALRIASRPPDPSMRYPAELGTKLSDAAGAALNAEAPADRWLAVLDAVSVSPVRRSITPAGLPPEPGDDFIKTLTIQLPRVPGLGPLLGMKPPKAPGPPPRPPKPLPHRRPPGAAAPDAPAADGDSDSSHAAEMATDTATQEDTPTSSVATDH
jgi:hypothetical protein